MLKKVFRPLKKPAAARGSHIDRGRAGRGEPRDTAQGIDIELNVALTALTRTQQPLRCGPAVAMSRKMTSLTILANREYPLTLAPYKVTADAGSFNTFLDGGHSWQSPVQPRFSAPSWRSQGASTLP